MDIITTTTTTFNICMLDYLFTPDYVNRLLGTVGAKCFTSKIPFQLLNQ